MKSDESFERVEIDTAKQALQTADVMRDAGFREGVSPKWFSVVTALWAGALAASMGSGLLLVILFVGIGLFAAWRRRVEAWLLPTQGPEETTKIWAYSAIVGAMFIAGYMGLELLKWSWAPYLAGVLIAALQYFLMERSYAPLRASEAR